MIHWMSKRLQPFGPSIFDTLGGLALEKNCVNLGQGFPDFDGPEFIKKAAYDAMRAGHNQYAPLGGVLELRQVLALKYFETTGHEFDPRTEITVMNGATQAMFTALTAILNRGDEVIFFAPIYDTYVPTIKLCGAKPVVVPLEPPEFRFDPQRLRAAFSAKTRAIVINSPHNPTGRVFAREELEMIRDLCVEFDCFAVTDEVYEHLVWGERKHIPLVSLEGMRERTITVSSTAKTFSLTGWKIGWAIAPPNATLAIRRLHQYISFAIATPLQWGMAEALRHRRKLIAPLYKKLAGKRDRLCKGLSKLGFKVFEPEGTFFALADFSPLSAVRDLDLAYMLLEGEAKVAVIPISGFYLDPKQAPTNYVRFCFAKRNKTLDRGLAQLAVMGEGFGASR